MASRLSGRLSEGSGVTTDVPVLGLPPLVAACVCGQGVRV
jgi:hypothetical protein